MAIILAMFCGAGLGYILERGDFCFHSTMRGLVRKPVELDLFNAYLLTLLVSIPLVQGLRALGWIEPWIPPFVWQMNVLGGLVFGMGMVVAATCVTGLFYKLGHGMLGTLVGLAGWAAGDLLVYAGPLKTWREESLQEPITVSGESATVYNALGSPGILFGAVILLLIAAYLYRSARNDRGSLWSWPKLGAAAGAFTSLAWLLADIGNADYPYGTSGVPTHALQALLGQRDGGGSLWIPIALASLAPGAFLAAKRAETLWIRGETARRYLELASGGLLMGVGAGIAGGCNLGHSLVGVPLFSLGSITTTLAMFSGVLLADRIGRLLRTATKVEPTSPVYESSK